MPEINKASQKLSERMYLPGTSQASRWHLFNFMAKEGKADYRGVISK